MSALSAINGRPPLSNRALHPARRKADAGFTLIEMLVVVVIIGVMTAGFLLALGTRDSSREVERETRRLDAVLDFARERAELQLRSYGLRMTDTGYSFLLFDAATSTWIEIQDEVLRPHELKGALKMDLWVEGRKVVLEAPKPGSALVPQIAISSTGEITSFEVAVRDASSSNPAAGLRLTLGDDGELVVRDPGAPALPGAAS